MSDMPNPKQLCKMLQREIGQLQTDIERKAEQIDEQNKELEKHRWIPVSERLPEDDSSAYLFLHESGNVHQGIPSCDLYGPDGKLWHSITHWKPIILPEQALKVTGE